MKKSEIFRSASIAGMLTVCLTVFVTCNTDAIYDEEMYKTRVYLLSGTDNIYVESYTLNETEPVKYFSVGCGGSKANEKEIVVQLEPDLKFFEDYNRLYSDAQSVHPYAKLLPANRYEIGSLTATIPAKSTEQYVKVSVKVRPLGLSPDTIYFIPLSIKSVSHYEVNEDKHNMLYRVTIENEYSRQKTNTQYSKKGEVQGESAAVGTLLTGTKMVQPLTHDKVRLFVSNYTQGPTSTVADIERLSIVVQVKPDKSLDITPYGTMEVEMLPDIPDEGVINFNRYDPKVVQGLRTYRVFYLHYRYRLLQADGSFTEWYEMTETLTRIEED